VALTSDNSGDRRALARECLKEVETRIGVAPFQESAHGERLLERLASLSRKPSDSEPVRSLNEALDLVEAEKKLLRVYSSCDVAQAIEGFQCWRRRFRFLRDSLEIEDFLKWLQEPLP
jgi:hypothetical protein